MIYTIIASMGDDNQQLVTKTSTPALPTTVMEMAGPHRDRAGQSLEGRAASDAPITVLDLSNPKDAALVQDAGYDMLELSSASVASYADSEAGSSDTLSVMTGDDLTDLDPEIARAAARAMETGSLTPLIKEELKCNIQKRRLEEGKDTLKVDFGRRKRQKEELTAEEEDRRKRRRERNKVAAQKCRNKRREKSECLQEQSEELEKANDTLKEEIEKLEHEKEMLRNMLMTHDICPRTCNTRLSTCSDASDKDESSPPAGQLHGFDACDGDIVVVEDLDIQMELEVVNARPESPFNVELIGSETLRCVDDDNVFTK